MQFEAPGHFSFDQQIRDDVPFKGAPVPKDHKAAFAEHRRKETRVQVVKRRGDKPVPSAARFLAKVLLRSKVEDWDIVEAMVQSSKGPLKFADPSQFEALHEFWGQVR